MTGKNITAEDLDQLKGRLNEITARDVAAGGYESEEFLRANEAYAAAYDAAPPRARVKHLATGNG